MIAADALSAERSPLSHRELDVLRTATGRATGADIARALHPSEGTVRNHLSSILQKLDVSTRHQAVDHAREHGWI